MTAVSGNTILILGEKKEEIVEFSVYVIEKLRLKVQEATEKGAEVAVEMHFLCL